MCDLYVEVLEMHVSINYGRCHPFSEGSRTAPSIVFELYLFCTSLKVKPFGQHVCLFTTRLTTFWRGLHVERVFPKVSLELVSCETNSKLTPKSEFGISFA